MVKKSTLLLTSIILLSGCTREVYLQSVPCVEGNCDCPCISETRECCPETQMQTQTIRYQIIDGPVVPVTYQPCNQTRTTKTTTTTTTRRCQTIYCQ